MCFKARMKRQNWPKEKAVCDKTIFHKGAVHKADKNHIRTLF